ncbi:LuxR C-terminal-related transcriptional regulator [Pontibacter harenae]|uniref:LuxR C-terminal-related transcriptional regulator n=1 Tax=Pontibacter harenae TaxID=2894083 RepID=UPI001E3A3971|nr:response regulator transcription factor [Pontibacter harenae]MCC9168688.1 response regulator transcription factor [Pontibacter harenae]
MERKIRLGVVEDTAAVVLALRLYFELSEEVELVFASHVLEDLPGLCRDHAPDVLLVDIHLGHFSGIDALKLVQQSFPLVKVVMFTVYNDDEHLFESIAQGASGYLLKGTPAPEIESAIIETYKGGASMTPLMNIRLLQVFRKNNLAQRATESLTTRENDILQALVNGWSYKQVALELHISLGTVRTHIEHIYRKLNVNSKAEAVAKFLKG